MKPRASGGPGAGDLSRLLLARASSRLNVGRAGEAFADATLSAFRKEIGGTVRTVSPLLVAMLRHEGMDMDDLAWSIMPAKGWPDRPRLPASRQVFHPARRAKNGSAMEFGRTGRPFHIPVAGWHGVELFNPNRDCISIYVVDHSIETAGRIGEDWFTSLFGSVRTEVPLRSDETLPGALVGAPVERIFDLPPFRGHGWIVGGVNEGAHFAGLEVAFRTGAKRYRLPWTR